MVPIIIIQIKMVQILFRLVYSHFLFGMKMIKFMRQMVNVADFSIDSRIIGLCVCNLKRVGIYELWNPTSYEHFYVSQQRIFTILA